MSSAFEKISLLIKNSILQKIIGFAAIAIYARSLAPEELAVFPIYGLLAGLSIVLTGFGLEPLIVRDLSSHLEKNEFREASEFFHHVMNMGWFAGASFALIVIFFRPFFSWTGITSSISDPVFIVLALGVAFECLNIIQVNCLVASGQVKTLARVGLWKSIMLPIMVLTFHNWLGFSGAVIALSTISFTTQLITSYLLRKLPWISPPSTKGLNITPYINILRESWPYYFDGIVIYIRRQGDQLFISSMLGAGALGIYFVAQRLADVMAIFITSIDRVLTSKLAMHKARSNEKVKESYLLICIISITLSIPLALGCFVVAPAYIELVSGGKYINALLPTFILAFKFIPDLIRSVAIGGTLIASASSSARLRVTFLETLILLPFLYAAISYGGISGAAFASVATGLLSVCIGATVVKSTVKVEFPYKLFAINLTFAALIIMGFWLFFSSHQHNPIAVSIIGSGATLVIYAFLFANSILFVEFERASQICFPVEIASLASRFKMLRII